MLEVIGYMLIGVFFAMLMPVLRALVDAAIVCIENKKQSDEK